MKRFKFNTEEDVVQFIKYLIDNGLNFHLDDDPEEINWWKTPVSEGDIAILKLNMIDLWDYCDPWLVLSKHPEIEDAYIKGERL